MKRVIISEEERKRILGMHVEATKRHYGLVNEQDPSLFTNDGKTYNWRAIRDFNSLNKFIGYITDGTNSYGKDSWNKLKDKGINIAKDIYSGVDGGLGLDPNLVNQPFSKEHPYYQLMVTYRDGLDKVAQLGRLLKPDDVNGIRTAIKDNRVTPISNYILANHINKLAEGSQKTNFPDYPFSS